MTFSRLNPAGNGKKWAWLTRLLLVGVILAYSSLYFANTYPISEGWGVNYSELIFGGKVPYRDFYYYLPPLNLLIDCLFWKLSFGSLLAFRAWYLLERIVISVMIFNLLKKHFHHAYAFVACAFTAILSCGDVYDLFGDYNQTMSLLAVALAYCAVGFVDAETLKSKLLRLFAAGLVLGLMFLNKQTIFLASFITYFVAITALCIRKRDGNYLKYCLAVAGGVVIPMAAAGAWLAAKGALIPFIEQVFLNVDGKGSMLTILIVSLSSRMFNVRLWGFILLGFGLALVANARRKNENALIGRTLGQSATVLAAALAALFCATYRTDIAQTWAVLKTHPKMTLAFIASLAPYGAVVLAERLDAKRRGKTDREPFFRLLKMAALFAGGALCLFCTAINEEFSAKIYNNTALFSYVQGDLSLWCVLSMLAVACFCLVRSADSHRAERLLMIACAGFALYYSGVMGTGTSAGPAHLIRIALPLLLCMIFSMNFSSKTAALAVKGAAWAVCLALSVACVSQKVSNSYSWWGSAMEPISQKTYTTDIPALKGVKMSKERKEQYETIVRLIEENSDEDAVVWGYPHNKLFNILTGRYEMNTFVPVLFYDVTADRYIEKELEMLQENLPDIVVWQDIPYCVEVHEEVFRDGEPLKQREIMEYFEETIPEKYTLIGSAGDVFVYRLNDGKAVKETSFETDVYSWSPQYGVDDWSGDGHWCRKESGWNVRSPLPAAQEAQLYLYATVGDEEAVGALEIRVNGERVKMVRIRPGNHTVELQVDADLQAGDNLIEINVTTDAVEDNNYFKAKGFSVQLHPDSAQS